MWSIIPTSVASWIVVSMIFLGLVGLLAGWISRWIPFFGQYRVPLQIVGAVLLLGGIYLRGGQDVELAWRARVAEYEAQIARAEQESRDANDKLSQAIKQKNKEIKAAQEKTRERIKQNAQKIDAECRVPAEAVDILNESAKKKRGKVTITR